MIHKKIEQVEKEYLDKRKEYQQIKEQLEDYRRVSKRKTENLVDYILTIYREVDLIHAKPFLSELEQNEEQMHKTYQKQIEEIEHQMLDLMLKIEVFVIEMKSLFKQYISRIVSTTVLSVVVSFFGGSPDTWRR